MIVELTTPVETCNESVYSCRGFASMKTIVIISLAVILLSPNGSIDFET